MGVDRAVARLRRRKPASTALSRRRSTCALAGGAAGAGAGVPRQQGQGGGEGQREGGERAALSWRGRVACRCQWRSKMSHLWRLKMSHSAGGDEPLVRRRLPAASLPPRLIVPHLTAGG